MDERPRIQLADYLVESEIETHILVQEEDSVRADWWRASCGLHNWYTTGSKPNVEDAAAQHVAWDHPACAVVDPYSAADAPMRCRELPGHTGDHANGGHHWANYRTSTTPGCPGTTEASARTASHYFATDRDRESFLGYFGDKLDTWFTPEFAHYVRTGTYPEPVAPETFPFAMQRPEYEVENLRLWERAAEADLARVQAELRAAKLRLVLGSALRSFTKWRRRGLLRTNWIEAARVEQWRRVYEETGRAAREAPTGTSADEAGDRMPPQQRQATRYLCPITGCEWYHDRPDVPDFPWQWKGSIEETVYAGVRDQVQEVEKAISDHLATHPVLEWFREVRQQQDRADGAERELADLRERVGLYVDPSTRDAILGEQNESGRYVRRDAKEA